MAYWTNFEGMMPEDPADAASCAVCEALVPDAVDGLLSEAQQRAFDRHVAGCVECARELEEAQRGAAWLAMLKSKAPEPPADLLAKILAGTTGAPAVATAPVAAAEPAPMPAFVPAKPAAPAWAISSLWQRAMGAFRLDSSKVTFQPRLAMTAAMAFFSVALTLNLMGVRLKDINAADFTPSGMRHAVGDLSASATQKFQNLKVVYQVESRVSELREDESPLTSRGDGPTEPRTGDGAQRGGDATQPAPQQQPEQGGGQNGGQNGAPGHTQLVQPVLPQPNGQRYSQASSLRKDL